MHSFSRRQFQSSDLTSTLTELDLAGPNALIVVPRRQGGGSGARGGSGGGAAAKDDGFSVVALFWLIMTPFVLIFNLLRDVIFGAPAQRPAEGTASSASLQPSATSVERRNDLSVGYVSVRLSEVLDQNKVGYTAT